MEQAELRPAPGDCAEYYHRYIDRLPAGDVVNLLARQYDDTRALLARLSDADASYAYAPGKWTVREVVGHVADTERVMSYRALRIGRGDATPLPGFEQDDYVATAAFEDRPLADLLDEWGAVRAASIALLRGLPHEAWTRRGTASGHDVTVLALACIIAGHELHHRAQLAEVYLPGLRASEPQP